MILKYTKDKERRPGVCVQSKVSLSFSDAMCNPPKVKKKKNFLKFKSHRKSRMAQNSKISIYNISVLFCFCITCALLFPLLPFLFSISSHSSINFPRSEMTHDIRTLNICYICCSFDILEQESKMLTSEKRNLIFGSICQALTKGKKEIER